MGTTQEVKLVKSSSEQFTGWVVAAIYVAVIYYGSNPDALEQHREILARQWRKLAHRYSVWRALQEIRTLDVTVVTGHNQ